MRARTDHEYQSAARHGRSIPPGLTSSMGVVAIVEDMSSIRISIGTNCSGSPRSGAETRLGEYHYPFLGPFPEGIFLRLEQVLEVKFLNKLRSMTIFLRNTASLLRTIYFPISKIKEFPTDLAIQNLLNQGFWSRGTTCLRFCR